MLRNVIQTIKPIVVALLVILVLKGTGLLSSVSYYAQSALVVTGFRDAGSEKIKKPETFDYQFVVRDQHGTRINFSAFKGKVIFLNLWATWCGPCRAEMPTIQSLYDHAKSDSVVFVMLSVDDDGAEAKINRYIDNNKFTFPVYRPSGYLTEQLNVPGIPTTLIISKEGKIVSKEVGATNFDTPHFRKFLEKLSKE
jgi:thiol-disulfide isomerase/thioredoxin